MQAHRRPRAAARLDAKNRPAAWTLDFDQRYLDFRMRSEPGEAADAAADFANRHNRGT